MRHALSPPPAGSHRHPAGCKIHRGVLKRGKGVTWHGTRSIRSMCPTRAGYAASSSTAAAWRCHGAERRSAPWRTTARTRAGRSARARSRRAGCGARGTATTTTRSPADRLRASPTPSPTYPVEERDDGVFVELPDRHGPARTVADVLVETLVNFGITHVFGMVGHSNLGFADALRRAEERGQITYIGIRHEGAAAFAASAYGKLTGRPAVVLRHRRAGLDEPAHRSVRRQARRVAGRGHLRPGAVQGPRPWRVPGRRPVGGVPDVAVSTTTVTPAATTPNWPRWRSSTPSTAGASPTSCCPTRCRPCRAQRAGGAGRPTARPPGASAPTALRSTRAADLIDGAHRPVIIVGHGARGARDQVMALAERLGAPVLTTFKAKGLSRTAIRSAPGCSAAAARRWRSWLMNEADLLDRGGCLVRQPHRHRRVQADRADRRRARGDRPLRRRRPRVLLGDAALTPGRLLDAARRRRGDATSVPTSRPAGRSGARRRRAGSPTTAARASRPRRCSTRSHGTCPTDAVVAVDVGNHAYSLGRYLESQGPTGADVGLPRLDRLRLSRPRWAPGRRRRAGRSSR